MGYRDEAAERGLMAIVKLFTLSAGVFRWAVSHRRGVVVVLVFLSVLGGRWMWRSGFEAGHTQGMIDDEPMGRQKPPDTYFQTQEFPVRLVFPDDTVRTVPAHMKILVQFLDRVGPIK
jgi:hypothetical protein